MAETSETERARQSLDLYMDGDWEQLRDFYADDVVWHVGGKHPLSGDYRGRDRLFEYFEQVRSLTGGSLKVEAESILASDKHTAMFTRVTGQRDDKSLDVSMAQIFKVGPDGRWNEYWALADDQNAVDAFWS